MTTIAHRKGSSDTLVLRPRQPDGAAPDLAGLTVQMRIASGSACIPLDAVPVEGGFEVSLTALDLPPRAYRASVWYSDGRGWRWAEDFTLLIGGGC